MLKLKKIFCILTFLSFLVTLPLAGSYASAETTNVGEINLKNVDLSNLKPGDEITVDGFTIKQYTNEEAAKIIAEQTGQSEKEVLNRLNKLNSSSSENKSLQQSVYQAAAGKCAQGATAFSRALNVTSSYKPRLHIWTELCQNSAGQYVVKSIVDISIDRSYNGTTKGFQGSAVAKALNSGKTLFYRVDGDFYHNESTNISGSTGLNTPVATVNFSVSTTLNHYAYIYQTENIILFD